MPLEQKNICGWRVHLHLQADQTTKLKEVIRTKIVHKEKEGEI